MSLSPTQKTEPMRAVMLTATCEIDAEASASASSDGKPTPLPRFRMVAYTGGPMRLAGWRYPVIVDLAGLAIPSQNRPIRFGHDSTHGVGHTDTIRVEAGQLVAGGVVSRDTSAAREIVISSKNGFPWQASIGASVEEFEFVKESQKVIANGRTFEGPVNVVRKATLGEISFVDLGADGNTSALVAALHAPQEPTMSTPTNAQANLAESNPSTPVEQDGLPPTTSSGGGVATQPSVLGVAQAVTRSPSIGARTEQAASSAPNANQAISAATEEVQRAAVTRLRADALAESQRIAAVRQLCAGQFPEVEARAIGEGWDAMRTELEVLRSSRPKIPAPASIVRADSGATALSLEAACAMTAKLQDLESHYDARTLESAHRRFRGGIGLQELLLEAAWANGYEGRKFRDSKGVLRAAFGCDVRAGLSLIDIGGILSNVANKFLLDGFFAVERTWRNLCAVRNVADFKQVTSYRLIGTDQYELVAPGGELKHGTLGNETYSNKADTYGLTLSIDRRDIINDDLGAITTVPRKLGRGSGLKINDVFWTVFLNNGSFFTTGNKNYLVGVDTALTIDGMTKAEVTFMDQVDSDGKPIGVMPQILLVPTALSAMATQLQKSLEIRDTTGSTKYPVANPHQGKFRAEVSRYLANSKYTGNSAKAWYLLSDPNDLPVIEVAFLNGNESPTIESAEADFNQLGVKMRGYHDFGVALQDPRGGVKAKGEA